MNVHCVYAADLYSMQYIRGQKAQPHVCLFLCLLFLKHEHFGAFVWTFPFCMGPLHHFRNETPSTNGVFRPCLRLLFLSFERSLLLSLLFRCATLSLQTLRGFVSFMLLLEIRTIKALHRCDRASVAVLHQGDIQLLGGGCWKPLPGQL